MDEQVNASQLVQLLAARLLQLTDELVEMRRELGKGLRFIGHTLSEMETDQHNSAATICDTIDGVFSRLEQTLFELQR